jgi:SAM-dependent methyltransferase
VASDRESALGPLLERHAARAAGSSPEAAVYWQRHAIRFEFLLRRLEPLRGRVRTALDVGTSFQTPLLAERFPDWRIDTLADIRDERFLLPPPSRHTLFDLNQAQDESRWPAPGARYDLIVFMEVVEHLSVPPRQALRFLASLLEPEGMIVLTTPNAAWLKNRIKMLRGRNPFELLREDRQGHIREYTLGEMREAAESAGLEVAHGRRCGLYAFSGAKDRFYSALADATFPGLRRTLYLELKRR